MLAQTLTAVPKTVTTTQVVILVPADLVSCLAKTDVPVKTSTNASIPMATVTTFVSILKGLSNVLAGQAMSFLGKSVF